MTFTLSIDTAGWTAAEIAAAPGAAHRMVRNAGLYVDGQPWGRWTVPGTLALDCASADPSAVVTSAALLTAVRQEIADAAAAAAADAAALAEVRTEIASSPLRGLRPSQIEDRIRTAMSAANTPNLATLRAQTTAMLVEMGRTIAVLARKASAD